MCAQCCAARQKAIFHATLDGVAKTDPALAQQLKDAFMAVTNCETKSAKLFCKVVCDIVIAYGNGELEAYLNNNPSLPDPLLNNIQLVFDCYIE